MASSSVSASVGSPFVAFEGPDAFALPSFLSVAARRYGPAKMAAVSRKIIIVVKSEAGRFGGNWTLQEEALFIFHLPSREFARLAREVRGLQLTR